MKGFTEQQCHGSLEVRLSYDRMAMIHERDALIFCSTCDENIGTLHARVVNVETM